MPLQQNARSEEHLAEEEARNTDETRVHGEAEKAAEGEAESGPKHRTQDTQPVEGEAAIHPPPGSEYTQRSRIQG